MIVKVLYQHQEHEVYYHLLYNCLELYLQKVQNEKHQ